MSFSLSDLLADVVAALPAERKQAMAAIVDQYGATDTCRFLMALVAGSDSRERRLARLLMSELDRLEGEQQDGR